MKLQELKSATFHKVNGTNTSGENHFMPRLFRGNGEEIQWQPDPEGVYIDDCGFWHHDVYCLIPYGEKVYMPGKIEFIGSIGNTKMRVLEWLEFDIESAEQGSGLVFAS